MSAQKRTYFFLITLVVCSSWSKQDFLEAVEARFNSFMQRYPQHKVNLVFHQPAYAPGDTAFFSAWYTHESLEAVSGITTITVDLVAGNGETLQRLRFNVRNGRGNNQIIFRKDLPPGFYKIMAYSTWMRNFGSSVFFETKVRITGRKEIREVKESEIAFHPEGGRFVANVSNHVVVTGPPLARISIMDHRSENVASATLDSSGIASVVLTPTSNGTYTGVDVTGRRWPLPGVVSDGVTIVADRSDPRSISISASHEYAAGPLFVVVCSRGKIIFRERIDDAATAAIRIPSAGSNSLCQIFIFNENGLTIGQRIIYLPPAEDAATAVRIDLPDMVKQRDSIYGYISLTDGRGRAMEFDATLTAYQADLFEVVPSQAIPGISDLPAVAAWIDLNGVTDAKSINDFLVTQTWNRIKWDLILGQREFEIRYPLNSHMKLQGRVRSRNTGQPPPDSTLLLAYLQKNTFGYEVYVNKGDFEVPFSYPFWGSDLIFCTLEHRGRSLDDEYVITISNDTGVYRDRWSSAETEDVSRYGDYLFKRTFVTNSFSFFTTGKGEQEGGIAANRAFEDELQPPDLVVNLRDYVVFPTIPDLLHEVIPFVKYRKRSNGEVVRISYRLNDLTRVYEGDPLYIIDGVMTRKTSFFLSLKPEDLSTIKVINHPNKLAQLGKLGANGLILVESKKGNLSGQLKQENIFPVTGLSEEIAFDERGSTRPRVPDLRAVLQWMPSHKSDAGGRARIGFLASDDIGPVRVTVRGITSDNRLFHAEKIIQITFNDGADKDVQEE